MLASDDAGQGYECLCTRVPLAPRQRQCTRREANADPLRDNMHRRGRTTCPTGRKIYDRANFDSLALGAEWIMGWRRDVGRARTEKEFMSIRNKFKIHWLQRHGCVLKEKLSQRLKIKDSNIQTSNHAQSYLAHSLWRHFLCMILQRLIY